MARNDISPSAFADPCEAERTYLPLLDSALKKASLGPLRTPDAFLMQRGAFVIAHADDGKLDIPGKLIDIFDPDLALCENVRLTPGQSGLYRDVAEIMKRGEPALLHTTHRLISQEYKNGILRFTIRGPAQTPAVARVFMPKRESAKITATDTRGGSIEIDVRRDGDTIRLKFANNPGGVTVSVE